ncbi:hypothetical protein, partial [Bacillus sp. JJ722]|uniref:hypothetical protein n=1 Tax=Bacillus sp. JJ722 TaxID=3122973 RepID=UPI002FFDC9ED
MEKIKSYHSIKSFLNENQREKVAEMLNLKDEDLTRRQEGKEAEYEFLLRCFVLGKIEDVIAFEEGVSKLTNTVTTDYLFILKDGKRLAIEVKSTGKERWKISSKLFQEKKNFANLISAELYFALKIKGSWLLLSGDYIEKKGYKVGIDSLFDSELSMIGEKKYIFLNPIKINSIYNQNSDKSLIV